MRGKSYHTQSNNGMFLFFNYQFVFHPRRPDKCYGRVSDIFLTCSKRMWKHAAVLASLIFLRPLILIIIVLLSSAPRSQLLARAHRSKSPRCSRSSKASRTRDWTRCSKSITTARTRSSSFASIRWRRREWSAFCRRRGGRRRRFTATRARYSVRMRQSRDQTKLRICFRYSLARASKSRDSSQVIGISFFTLLEMNAQHICFLFTPSPPF